MEAIFIERRLLFHIGNGIYEEVQNVPLQGTAYYEPDEFLGLVLRAHQDSGHEGQTDVLFSEREWLGPTAPGSRLRLPLLPDPGAASTIIAHLEVLRHQHRYL